MDGGQPVLREAGGCILAGESDVGLGLVRGLHVWDWLEVGYWEELIY